MISKIKEYGPITLAWFGGIQFLQPLIPNDPRKYITCQTLILLVSFIIALAIITFIPSISLVLIK